MYVKEIVDGSISCSSDSRMRVLIAFLCVGSFFQDSNTKYIINISRVGIPLNRTLSSLRISRRIIN